MIATRGTADWLLFELPEPEDLAGPENAGGALRWLRIARDGEVQSGEATAAELAERVRPDQRLLALVPGERAPLHRVAVPGKSARVRQRALPYALEERLSEDLESVHIVPGPPHGSETTACVVALRHLQQWEGWLAARGLGHARLIPDIALLRGLADGDHHYVLAGETRCLLVPADAEPLALPRDLAAWWLKTRELPEPEHPGHADAAPLTPSSGWQGSLLELLAANLRSGTLDAGRLRRWLRAARPFELGTRRQQDRGRSILPGPEWRLPASLAVVLGLAWLGGQWLQIHYLERELAATEDAMAEVFARALPERRMVDPVGQFEILLREPETAAGPEGITSPLAEPIALIAEQLDDDTLTLRHLRGDANRLELELDGPGLADIERLRENLQQAIERRVRITSAETGNDRVRARLILEEEP
ncbi:type II secretion system protein GspL [Thioalkalivibrio sp. ALR17-21]|uniref:type II secretion system protein GspL n=1 Tax=Thioalkalivibrio sp. ALR17-21 TaxID=1269813 RepID=UPI000400F1E2|nr:type II secretion system protein GspL [Thioalkalivibrio sp. ALR17-21]